MRIAGDPLRASIEARCAWALEQQRRYGARLAEEEGVARLLAELRAAMAASREAMIAAGLVEACRACEEEEGGSCCGRGMEDHCDGVLLLVNRLLGAVLGKRRRDEQSCFFLGAEGCRLAARDPICVNYLCRKISEQISPPTLAELRARQGRELHILFLLTDHVTTRLRSFQSEPEADPAPRASGTASLEPGNRPPGSPTGPIRDSDGAGPTRPDVSPRLHCGGASRNAG